MKIPTASSATSSQRGQTSLRSLMPRLPRSNVYSMRDPENLSASVHRNRFLTPSLALKFLCTGELNPRRKKGIERTKMWVVVQKKNRHQLSDFVTLAAEVGFPSVVFSLNLTDWGQSKWNASNSEILA